MTSDLPRILLPIIVEGRYDKSTLRSIFDAHVITTGGFSIFNNKEKQALLKKLAYDGIIVLTDSDGGGAQIRSFLQGIIPKDKIYNLYIPRKKGKEKRKDRPSRAGLIGVEGMDKDTLLSILAPFINNEKQISKCRGREITKSDFYFDGLSGGDNSSSKRAALANLCDLPSDMSANALLEALNLLFGYDEYKRLVEKIAVDA